MLPGRVQMPFKSQAQRGWMYATHPQMAERWQQETPEGKKLPRHVGKVKPSAGLRRAAVLKGLASQG